MKKWHRVKAPGPRRPKVNDELIGTYVSNETRVGRYGEYKVHYIKSNGLVYYVSGVLVNDLFALIQPDTKVKLVFVGMRRGHEDKCYR